MAPVQAQRSGRPGRAAGFQVGVRDVKSNAEKLAVVPRFSHQAGPSAAPVQQQQNQAERRSNDAGGIQNHRHSGASSVIYQKTPSSGAQQQQEPVFSPPDYSLDEFPPSSPAFDDKEVVVGKGGNDVNVPGSLGHAIIQKAFEDNFFSSEADDEGYYSLRFNATRHTRTHKHKITLMTDNAWQN
jgi:hypothetical protein